MAPDDNKSLNPNFFYTFECVGWKHHGKRRIFGKKFFQIRSRLWFGQYYNYQNIVKLQKTNTMLKIVYEYEINILKVG